MREIKNRYRLDRDGELHLHLDDCEGCLTTYCETSQAIKDGVKIIHTTIPHFLSWNLYRRLFVHVNAEVHEITLGDCDGIQGYICEDHNLELLLIDGNFSYF